MKSNRDRFHICSFYTLKIKKGNFEFERGKHGLQPGIYCKCRLNIEYCNNSILVLNVPTYCRYKGTISKDGGKEFKLQAVDVVLLQYFDYMDKGGKTLQPADVELIL